MKQKTLENTHTPHDSFEGWTAKDMEDKIYFVGNPDHDPSQDTVHGSNKFIAIKHGETTYSNTTVYEQAHADTLNERQGITKAMADAAHTCSMFNNWASFDGIVKTLGRLL